MAIKDALLREFDHEAATTRKTIERIPDEKLSFQPHPKSFTMAGLITHLVQIPGWGTITMTTDEFDIEPDGKKYVPPPEFTSTQAAVEAFDKNIAACRAGLDSSEDSAYTKEWRIKKNGETRLASPRAVVMRSFVMNHLIHHRGQLTVYLRLAGISVPEIYGPTADEGSF